MDLEAKVDRLATDFAEHRGEMREFTKNMVGWTGAVSRKVDEHVAGHAESDKEEAKARRDWTGIGLAAAIGILTMIAEVFFHGKH